MPFFDRLNMFEGRLEKKVNDLKKEKADQEEKENRECTFQPQIFTRNRKSSKKVQIHDQKEVQEKSYQPVQKPGFQVQLATTNNPNHDPECVFRPKLTTTTIRISVIFYSYLVNIHFIMLRKK